MASPMHRLYTLSAEKNRADTSVNLNHHTKLDLIALLNHCFAQTKKNHFCGKRIFYLAAIILYTRDSIYPNLKGVEKAAIGSAFNRF